MAINPDVPVWRQHANLVEKLLKSVTSKKIEIACVYLHGQPDLIGCVDLVTEVAKLLKFSRVASPNLFLHISSKETDTALWTTEQKSNEDLRSVLFDNCGNINAKVSQITDGSDPFTMSGYSLTLIMDVQVAASAEDEITFGHLVSWIEGALKRMEAGYEVHIAILLLGPRLSKRTFDKMRRLIPNIQEQEVDCPSRPIQFECVLSQSKDTVAATILQGVGQGKTVLLTSCRDKEWDVENFQLGGLRESAGCFDNLGFKEELKQLEQLVVDISGSCSFSASLNLTVVLSSGLLIDTQRDAKIGQLVMDCRRLTKCELDNAMAWTYKAKQGPRSVRFLTLYSQYGYQDRVDFDEALGPAWNKELPYLVLSQIAQWGGQGGKTIKEFPTREPPDSIAWRECYVRLTTSQCIRRDEDVPGLAHLTPKGESMRDFLDGGSSNWNVAWIISCCKEDTSMSSRARHILLMMAAILQDDKLTDFLCEVFVPMFHDRIDHGYLWIAVATFFHLAITLPALRLEEIPEISPWLTYTSYDVDHVESTWRSLAAGLNLPPLIKDGEAPLTLDEIAYIDKTLLWAHLHRVVCFDDYLGTDSEGKPSKDVYSTRNMVALQSFEFLEIEDCRRLGNQETVEGGFLAIYETIKRINQDQPSRRYKYMVRGLTLVSDDVVRDIERETEQPWPQFIALVEVHLETCITLDWTRIGYED
ncbi:hypothetical protein F5Y16DRAFT_398558 [Xylariaceae sp. FL0255]|nr:hypothetical protein F5Y16DRAFT_398558 [Xylariaceae sp. FL0255]